MSKLHFIWCGPGTDYETCVASVNRFATLPRAPKVYFWFERKHKNSFKRLKIHDKVIRRLFQVEEISPNLFSKKDWFPAAREVLKRLGDNKAYSAQKDLLSLMILYTHGGLYLDTTCRLANDAERRDYNLHSFSIPNDGTPRFAFLGGNVSHQPLLQTTEAIIEGRDRSDDAVDIMDEGEDFDPAHNPVPPGSAKVPEIDVWAMYSPENHEVLETAMRSYISRCHRIGISKKGLASNPNIIPLTSRDQVVRQYLPAKTDKDRYARNDIIGKLAVRSVYDGMMTGAPKDRWNAMGWPTIRKRSNGDEPLTLCVPKLGIVKTYKNSWRGK